MRTSTSKDSNKKWSSGTTSKSSRGHPSISYENRLAILSPASLRHRRSSSNSRRNKDTLRLTKKLAWKISRTTCDVWMSLRLKLTKRSVNHANAVRLGGQSQLLISWMALERPTAPKGRIQICQTSEQQWFSTCCVKKLRSDQIKLVWNSKKLGTNYLSLNSSPSTYLFDHLNWLY